MEKGREVIALSSVSYRLPLIIHHLLYFPRPFSLFKHFPCRITSLNVIVLFSLEANLF